MRNRKERNIILLVLLSSLLLIVVFVAQGRVEKSRMCLTCKPESYDESFNPDENIAIFEGKQIQIPKLAFVESKSPVLGISNEEKWIDVDLSEQKLRAWEGNSLYLEAPVSSGLQWWPTPKGEFRIWIKLRYAKMEGGSGKYYYYLPNVPYVMYFENDQVPRWKGYGIHGAYWHNDFGTPRSHGCVNIHPDVASNLYYWVSPILPDGKSSVKSTQENPGTRIVIHE